MEHGYIYINDNVFPSLFAISSEEQSQGLMYQEWPPPIMSFVYATPKVNKFWMKNTPSPLDIIFCCNGKVSQICYGEPMSTSIIGSDNSSDLIIELPHGMVDTSGIKIGHSVGIVRPSVAELKRIIAQNTSNL
jgi:uncharacterized membrane protein (UPF0127 family)